MQRRSLIQAAGAWPQPRSACPRVFAQDWPNGPVRIVVGFPPGGGTDALARVVGAKLIDDVEPAGHRREQGAASPACSRPSTCRSSRATAARC